MDKRTYDVATFLLKDIEDTERDLMLWRTTDPGQPRMVKQTALLSVTEMETRQLRTTVIARLERRLEGLRKIFADLKDPDPYGD